jgi:hypothetical protein
VQARGQYQKQRFAIVPEKDPVQLQAAFVNQTPARWRCFLLMSRWEVAAALTNGFGYQPTTQPSYGDI